MHIKKSGTIQVNLRLSKELRAMLETAATINNRSMNKEIVHRLMTTFTGKPRFRVPMKRIDITCTS